MIFSFYCVLLLLVKFLKVCFELFHHSINSTIPNKSNWLVGWTDMINSLAGDFKLNHSGFKFFHCLSDKYEPEAFILFLLFSSFFFTKY